MNAIIYHIILGNWQHHNEMQWIYLSCQLILYGTIRLKLHDNSNNICICIYMYVLIYVYFSLKDYFKDYYMAHGWMHCIVSEIAHQLFFSHLASDLVAIYCNTDKRIVNIYSNADDRSASTKRASNSGPPLASFITEPIWTVDLPLPALLQSPFEQWTSPCQLYYRAHLDSGPPLASFITEPIWTVDLPLPALLQSPFEQWTSPCQLYYRAHLNSGPPLASFITEPIWTVDLPLPALLQSPFEQWTSPCQLYYRAHLRTNQFLLYASSGNTSKHIFSLPGSCHQYNIWCCVCHFTSWKSECSLVNIWSLSLGQHWCSEGGGAINNTLCLCNFYCNNNLTNWWFPYSPLGTYFLITGSKIIYIQLTISNTLFISRSLLTKKTSGLLKTLDSTAPEHMLRAQLHWQSRKMP